MNKTDASKQLIGVGIAVTLLVCRDALAGEGITAIPCSDFLESIGTLSAISVRGETLQGTIESTRYLGIGWLRGVSRAMFP